MKKRIGCGLLTVILIMSMMGCGGGKEEGMQTGSAETEAVSAETESASTETESMTAETGPVTVMALKGPTAMGMAGLMELSDKGDVKEQYTFTVAGSVDQVVPAVVQGEADLASVPANLASVLYNSTEGGVSVLAINTLGVLYIVEKGNTLQTVQDLKGRTIYASGRGATPEYALQYILMQNGIDPDTDVTIEWKSEHTEVVAALAGSEEGIALLPEPFVTVAKGKIEGLRSALNLTKEWDALQRSSDKPSALVMGVLVGRKEFIQEHPEAVEAFLGQYEESVTYVNGSVDEAALLVEKYDIVPASVAREAIPACNITFIRGAEMKEKLSGYLEILMEQNPKAVGGALPDEDFYYQ